MSCVKMPNRRNSVNKNILGIIGVLGALLIVGSGLLYFNLMANPKVVFATNLQDSYTQMSELLTDFSNGKRAEMSSAGPIQTESTVAFEVNGDFDDFPDLIEIQTILQDVELYYLWQEDMANQNLFLDMVLSLTDDLIIDMNAFAEEDWLYILFDENWGKYIGYEGIDIFRDEESYYDYVDEIDYLMATGTDLLINSLLDEYFSAQKERVTVEGETYNVTKNSLVLNDERIRAIFSHVIEGLVGDEKAMQALETIVSSNEKITQDEIKEELQKRLESLEELSFTDEITYNIYTTGLINRVVKQEFLIKMEDFMGNEQEVKLSYFSFIDENNELVDKFVLQFADLKMELTVNEGEKTQYYSLVVLENNMQIVQIDFDLTRQEEVVNEKEEYNIDSDYQLAIKTDDYNLEILMKVATNLKRIDEIYKPEQDLLIKHDELTDEQKEKLNKILNELFGAMAFIPAFYGMTPEIKHDIFEATANGIVKTAENDAMQRFLWEEYNEDVWYVIVDGKQTVYVDDDGNYVTTDMVDKLQYLGDKPQNGVIYAKKNMSVEAWLHDGTWCARKDTTDFQVEIMEADLSFCQKAMPLTDFE